jgi:hypothetical protein
MTFTERPRPKGVEFIDATEAGADDKGVEVELLHLCFSVKSVSEQLKILPSETARSYPSPEPLVRTRMPTTFLVTIP